MIVGRSGVEGQPERAPLGNSWLMVRVPRELVQRQLIGSISLNSLSPLVRSLEGGKAPKMKERSWHRNWIGYRPIYFGSGDVGGGGNGKTVGSVVPGSPMKCALQKLYDHSYFWEGQMSPRAETGPSHKKAVLTRESVQGPQHESLISIGNYND